MNRLNRKLLLCAATLAASSIAGCASPSATGIPSEDEAAGDLALQAPATQGVTPDGNTTYFAKVVPNGTGCPAGTWNASISDDGLAFTVTFSAFEAIVSPTDATPFSIKDCQLEIQMNSPQGVSYAVSEFYYSGYALLEEGVTGTQSAFYYYQGRPLPPSTTNRTVYTGPVDKEFIFKDEVETQDLVWSQCGLKRNLNIRTSLRVQNTNPKKSGYMNLAAVDGNTRLVLRIATRRCGDAGPGIIIPDAGPIRQPR